jgi:glycosyltransferase involved in cell wall biosynthesis
MRIAVATDAWAPQVNGVVRSLSMTMSILLARGYDIELITPEQFTTVPMPGYREIRLAIAPRFGARRALSSFRPDVVHIVTEGPIGWSARAWCLKHDVPFTTAFHTRFPDYAAVRTGLSAERFWPIMRRFHGPSAAVLVATERLAGELNARGIPQTTLWSRGIDRRVFNAEGPGHPLIEGLARPVLLSVGRVAIEKNIEAFLSAPLPGSKVVVGEGPALSDLRRRYPDILFTGALHGAELASAYRSADAFVFPSLTDTFGLVMIEALACGTPVAGFPVPGPLDVVGVAGRGVSGQLPRPIGALDDDLPAAIAAALTARRDDAAAYGSKFDWDVCTDRFVAALTSAAARRGLGTQRDGLHAVENVSSRCP